MTGKPPPPAKPPSGNNTGYTETLRLPAQGPITSGFGGRRAPRAGASSNHKGIDIGVPTGTPVSAAASGTVTFVGEKSGYGKTIEITHDDNTVTRYAHLSEYAVQRGQTVVGGEVVAKSGATGRVTGPHLHYEVIRNGQQVNPLANTVGINANQRSQANTAFSPDSKTDQARANSLAALNTNQDEIIRSLISGEHFKDNAINDYDNITYHWRFFMTGDTEVVNSNTTLTNGDLQMFYEKLQKFDQVTIAESGVTTFSIDEVVMDATVGTDFQTESTRFTSIEMKVTEPNGVNFLDSLRNAALELGVRNYQKCFYYLELTFKGYNQDGSVNLKPFDGMVPNNGHWIWTVKINDIDVNLSAGGGSYNLKMVPLTDTLLTGTYNIIPSAVHPSGSTVGAMMDSLCEKLTNLWFNIKGDKIITYKAKFHPVADLLTAEEVRAMSVAPADQDLNPIQGFDFDANTNTASFAQGFTISRALDAIMTACEQAQKLATDELIDSGNGAYRQSILWRIEPEVHCPDYDPLYNEYYHDITLHVYGFRNHAAVLTPQDRLSNETAQKNILADMARRGFLPKKYEYLFTGVNSEVIDMDLAFNLKWQALLPSLASNTQEQAASQSRVDPKAAPAAVRPDANAARAQAETQTAQEVAQGQSSRADDAVKLEQDLEAAKKELAAANTEENQAKVAEAQAKYNAAKGALDQGRQVTQAKRQQLQANRPASLPQTNFGRTFGEDLNQNQSAYNLGSARENEAFPITVTTFTPTTSETVGLPGQFHNGKSVYGAVLNQVYGPMASQYFTIALTVKGDPFWIGAGSFEEAILRYTDEFDERRPNYPAGANCFLFRMKYPLGQDESGQIILNDNETITGIYQVNKVQHRFVDGKFTQVLTANRVSILSLYKTLYNQTYSNPSSDNNNNQPEPGTS